MKEENRRSYVVLKRHRKMYSLFTKDIRKIYKAVNRKLPKLPKYDGVTCDENLRIGNWNLMWYLIYLLIWFDSTFIPFSTHSVHFSRPSAHSIQTSYHLNSMQSPIHNISPYLDIQLLSRQPMMKQIKIRGWNGGLGFNWEIFYGKIYYQILIFGFIRLYREIGQA